MLERRCKFTNSFDEFTCCPIKISPINTNYEFHVLNPGIKFVMIIPISNYLDYTIAISISWCINQKRFDFFLFFAFKSNFEKVRN